MHRFFFVLVATVATPAFARADAWDLRGALLGDAPVRLQRAAVFFQENGAAPDLSETPVEQLTREQLQREYQRLDRERPSIGGPIALTAVGGGLLIAGGVVLLDTLATALYAGTKGVLGLAVYVLIGFSAALIITGGVLLTIGLVKLFGRIGERRAYGQRMDDINSRLETLDRVNEPPPPPPPESIPPPPPPGASFFDVQPTYVMATF